MGQELDTLLLKGATGVDTIEFADASRIHKLDEIVRAGNKLETEIPLVFCDDNVWNLSIAAKVTKFFKYGQVESSSKEGSWMSMVTRYGTFSHGLKQIVWHHRHDDAELNLKKVKARTTKSSPIGGKEPVSYTHLTLPTICSV